MLEWYQALMAVASDFYKLDHFEKYQLSVLDLLIQNVAVQGNMPL